VQCSIALKDEGPSVQYTTLEDVMLAHKKLMNLGDISFKGGIMAGKCCHFQKLKIEGYIYPFGQRHTLPLENASSYCLLK